MATPIRNQATLDYKSGTADRTAASNIATINLQGPLEVDKRALESGYQINDILTYTIIVKNTSPAQLQNLVITDDLGAYTVTGTTTKVVPLDYVGPTNEYLNNTFVSTVTPNATDPALVYNIATLEANSTLEFQYKVRTNEFALAQVGASKITNTVTVAATGLAEPATDSYEVPVASYADVVIEKIMEPNPVVTGSAVTYTFNISNYGTADATEVKLHDTFAAPAPTLTSVYVGPDKKTDTQYKYTKTTASGVFLYPTDTVGSTETFTIPKATFTPDPTTGVVTITPSTVKVVITGTL